MIKLPDDVLKAIADLHSQLVLCNRLNFCSDSLYNLEQTLIRNATAQPKCQKCGDTGMADSGGVQPWGEPILIDCDCAAAQPVSDGWVSLLADRQRSVINFALHRFMNDAYSNASIVAQDKRLDSSMVDTFTADARDAESLMSEITSYRDNLAAAPGGQDD